MTKSKCVVCRKKFEESDYAKLARGIIGHQPVCSHECLMILQSQGVNDEG